MRSREALNNLQKGPINRALFRGVLLSKDILILFGSLIRVKLNEPFFLKKKNIPF